ncbi:hypothetical protein QTJ16_000651 [Diplocarpon rosae]|uniref:Manganese lipoxygenase n=1 Tax=Diplocarpon rosae TaxID=946125 RepID=A0AAD9T627_9HELO|nr:hypothetical protein QTJ16_000651 [Diplocarpon rosae]
MLLPLLLLQVLHTLAATPQPRDIKQILAAATPQFSITNLTARAEAINVKRAGWLYGPSLLGNASYFPTGALAGARIQNDIALFQVDSAYIMSAAQADLALAKEAVAANGGLNTLEDYGHILYSNQWLSSVPGGTGQGILANYTDDLLFSMQRLSLNVYPLQRVKVADELPFELDEGISVSITGVELETLKNEGRLFVVDHAYQSKYTKSQRYGAACTALFFIHPSSGDFLPLAIKTNVGPSDGLIYTPLDTPNDWLLAKIMFNSNDLFHAQIFHLISSHVVAEIVHQSAMRTLSDEHPIMLLLERLMFQAYAVRPLGAQVLFNEGGYFDQTFYINHVGAAEFVAEWYPTVGRFQANYLETDLAARGLIYSASGPPLKHFPFLEDATAIRDGIKTFIQSFVDAYYPSEDLITSDFELQAWLVEASTAAQVLDFPCAPADGVPNTCSKKKIVDMLTHLAYLTGVQHHALNTGDPVTSQGTLPFTPASLYSPPPTSKNISSLIPFLPPASDALFQIYLLAIFNRPQYEAQNKTLMWQFSDPVFLHVFKEEVRVAAGVFKGTMERISTAIRGRSFDERGLCQGMPFLWKSLDPGTVPFFLAI